MGLTGEPRHRAVDHVRAQQGAQQHLHPERFPVLTAANRRSPGPSTDVGQAAAADIVRRRLVGQFLTGSSAQNVVEVVHALGAVQAQDYADAKWALALRARGARDVDIETELNRGSILRTHVLRPTWHFVAAEDICWLLALTGPRVNAVNAPRYRQLELDDATFRRSRKVLIEALSGGRHLTRAELSAALERVRIGTLLPNRLAHVLMCAELDALICSGPRRGKQFTYALLEERVAPVEPITRDEALLRLARRYFGTRGPATVHDFAWWSGLTMVDVKRAIDMVGREIERRTINGTSYFLLPSAPLPEAAATAHLLPVYDEYFIGFRDRSAITAHVADTNRLMRGDALTARFVLLNGQIAGRWRRALGKEHVALEVETLRPLSRAEHRRIAAQARRFGDFVGRSVAFDSA